jgi:hypothetical protein
VAKEFLKWMAAGVSGILFAAFQAIQAGNVNVKTILGAILGAVFYRAGSWLVATFGPKPA